MTRSGPTAFSKPSAMCLVMASALIILAASTSFAEKKGYLEELAGLRGDYQSMLGAAPERFRFGIHLSKTGQAWNMAGLMLAGKFNSSQVDSYLQRAASTYQINTAKSGAAEVQQLAGLNLIYQSVNGVSALLAAANKDSDALKKIGDTEQRIIEVIKRSEQEGPKAAALSGGIMSMLAILAEQVDRDGRMLEALSAEIDRRRAVDDNISNMKNLSPQERILLLMNNHIQGSISMVQIIGLVIDPDIRPQLKKVEETLILAKDQGLEAQIIGGAAALAQSTFITVPLLEKIKTP